MVVPHIKKGEFWEKLVRKKEHTRTLSPIKNKTLKILTQRKKTLKKYDPTTSSQSPDVSIHKNKYKR
jgi:hypothetical protein